MRKLLLAVLILAVLLLAPLLAMRSEKTLLFLSYWAVDSFTDLRLVLRDPILRPLKGDVSASEVHLYPKADDGPPFLSILGFSGRITAGDIYSGNLDDTSLKAAQVIIYVSDRDKTSDPKPMDWLQYVEWLPQHLQISQVHLVTTSESTFIFPLKNIVAQRSGHGDYQLVTEANYDGEPLLLEVTASAIRNAHSYTGLQLTASATAHQSESHVDLNGELRGDNDAFSYEFELNGSYKALENFLRGFKASPKLQGALKLHAELRGDSSGFSLRNANFALDNRPAYYADAKGTLDYSFSGASAIQLEASGELASMELLLDWIDFDLTPLGRAEGFAVINGDLQNPQIERFELKSQSEQGLNLSIGGNFDPLSPAAELAAIHLEASGPSFASLQDWTGPLSFEPGPFQASARLLGVYRPMKIDKLDIQIGSPETVQLQLTGEIGAVAANGESGLAALSGANLALALSTPDSRHLQPYLGDWLPESLIIDGTIFLRGSGEILNLTDGEIRLNGERGAQLLLQPTGGSIQPGKNFLLQDLTAKLALQLPDIAQLDKFTGHSIPALGKLEGTAILEQSRSDFALRSVAMKLTGEGIVASAAGELPKVSSLAGSRFALNLDINDPAKVASATGLKINPGSGEFTLSNENNNSELKGALTLGKTQVNSTARIDYHDGQVHKLQLSIQSPELHLRDIGLQADGDGSTAYKPSANFDGSDFTQSLEQRLTKTPDYESDIRLEFNAIEGDNTNINGFKLHLTGADKRYTLRDFSFNYDDSKAEARGIIDLNTSPPTSSFAVQALAIPLHTLTRDLGIDYPVRGFANIRGGLTSNGVTSEALLRNLDGSLAVALQNTVIEGAAYDVLATDLLAWFYSGAILEKSTHIDCTMADFKLNKGVARSDTLFIETSKMIATGKAKVDFDQDSMDIKFTPRSKSRALQVPSSVHIIGPFTKPAVTVSPIAAAFDATFEVISLVPQMARKLFGLDAKKVANQPCTAGGQGN